MKKIYFLLMMIFLTGCLHKNDSQSIQAGDVTVEGNVKNAVTAWHNYLPNLFKNAFAVDVISTRSTLVVTNPTRLDDISVAIGIQIDANVLNASQAKITGYKVDIFIEDEQFLTKESWTCFVCYSIGSGTECEGLYEIQGDRLFDNNTDPVLPACNSSVGSPALCVTQFNNNPDCSNPVYRVDYAEPGSGLQQFNIGNITVESLSSVINSVSSKSNGWLTGSNKYARFTLYNDVSVKVFEKDYVFNVVP